MDDFNIVILVSSDKSDLYFANQLMQRFNISTVVIEHQYERSQSTSKIKKISQLILRPHKLIKRIIEKTNEIIEDKFAIYNKPDKQLSFGEQGENIIPADNVAIIECHGKNSINSTESINHIKNAKPDLIAVCGTSLLSNEILSLPEKGALNLHGGLAQFYRGLWTTDWAIYNEEPEYIGATVHFIATGIDDGAILYQGRPSVSTDDNPHTLYQKVVKLGVDMMTQAIIDIKNNKQKPVALQQKGKLYLDNMTTPRIRRQTWAKLSKNIIHDYLKNKESRDKKVVPQLINPYSR